MALAALGASVAVVVSLMPAGKGTRAGQYLPGWRCAVEGYPSLVIFAGFMVSRGLTWRRGARRRGVGFGSVGKIGPITAGWRRSPDIPGLR
jgi:hypothetical protein